MRLRRGIPIVAALVVLGPPPAVAALTAEPHTTITGVGGVPTAYSATAAVVGDVNGDGRDDIATHTVCANQVVSTLTIVFGSPAGGTVSHDAPGARGFQLVNVNGCVQTVRLGDVNGDGRDDIGVRAGARTVVVYGRTATSPLDINALGPAGLTIDDGPAEQGVDIRDISAVGDVNGDGRADIGLSGLYITQTRLGVAGVLFGRAGGGTVDAGNPAAGGLLIGSVDGTLGVIGASGIGDLNGDGRADLLVADYGTGPMRVVLGRPAAGFLDPTAPGASAQVINRPAAVRGGSPVGDVNGDGLADLAASGTTNSPILLSARTGSVYDPARADRILDVHASLGRAGAVSRAGDLTGDGRDDIVAKATYPMPNVRWLFGEMAADLTYVVRGTATPGRVDLRLLGSWGARLDAIPDGQEVRGGARFSGTGRQLVTSAYGQVVVYDVVDRVLPADTTAPVIGRLGFQESFLVRTCTEPCYLPQRSGLTLTLDERAYVEVEIKRGTTLVARTAGTIPPGDRSLTFVPVERDGGVVTGRLPAGVYTANLRATDLAGNRTAWRSASLTLAG